MKTNVVAKADVMSLTIFSRLSKRLPSYKLGPNGLKIRQLLAHQIQDNYEVVKSLAMI